MREWTDCRGGRKGRNWIQFCQQMWTYIWTGLNPSCLDKTAGDFFNVEFMFGHNRIWSLKSRTVSEFRWTKSSLAHSRRPHQFFGATITWVPEKIFTKEESGQKPSRKLTLMKCWQFSCICKNSAVSQFSKVKRKEWKTGRNLYRLRDLRQLSNKSKEVNLVWTPVWTNPP